MSGDLGVGFTRTASGVRLHIVEGSAKAPVLHVDYTLEQAAEVASKLLSALGGGNQGPTAICEVSDCDRLTHSAGLCTKHYSHQHVHGHPTEKPLRAKRLNAKTLADRR